MKFGAGGVAAGLGLDFPDPAGMAVAGQVFQACRRTGEQRHQLPDRGGDARPVFRVDLWYEVSYLVTG